MAIFHLSMKVGRRGKSSAAAHAAYILREGQYAARITSGKERLESSGSGNLPSWATSDPLTFWAASDAFERSNGSTYREMELALPRELSADQRNQLLQDFISQEISDKHSYTFAIHNKIADDGEEQPHAHLMWSERQLDGIERDANQFFKRANKKDPTKGGAAKGWGDHAGQTLTAAERAADLQAIRARWATMTNSALAKAGHEEQVDSRTNLARNIMRAPERKIGPLGTNKQWDHIREKRAAKRAKNRPAPDAPKPQQKAQQKAPQPRLQAPQPQTKAKAPPRPQPPTPTEPSIYQRIAKAARVTETSPDVPFFYRLKIDHETLETYSPVHPALEKLMTAKLFHEHGYVAARAPLKAIGQAIEKQPSIAADILASITQHTAFRPELEQKQASRTAQQNRRDFQHQQQREARDIEREMDGWGL